MISNLNCHEIHEMIDTAREMDADLIEFTPVEILEGYTDALALSEQESPAVMEQLMTLRQRPDYLQRAGADPGRGRSTAAPALVRGNPRVLGVSDPA